MNVINKAKDIAHDVEEKIKEAAGNVAGKAEEIKDKAEDRFDEALFGVLPHGREVLHRFSEHQLELGPLWLEGHELVEEREPSAPVLDLQVEPGVALELLGPLAMRVVLGL